MAEIESTTLHRFIGQFVHRLMKTHKASQAPAVRQGDLVRLRDGHPITTHHNLGGVEFYLLWHGEQKWSIKTEQWSLRSRMVEATFTGDDQAFTRDMTMLMMIAELDDE